MTVQVNMEANSAQVESTIARLARQFRSTETQAKQVSQTVNAIGSKKNVGLDNTNKQLQQVNANLVKTQNTISGTLNNVTSSLQRAAITLGALFTGGAITKGLTSATDAMIQLENKIALVTGRTEELTAVQEQLFLAARATGGSVSGAAELFSKYGTALKDTRIESEELIRMTALTQKAFAVVGGSAAGADAAIIQLGQGMASGTLRGEELNSVLEQASPLARIFAKQLGISFGELRAAAADGAITAEVIRESFKNFGGDIEEDFAKTNFTTAQQMLALKDIVVKRMAEVSNALGVTAGVNKKINSLTDALSSIKPESLTGLKRVADLVKATFKFAFQDALIIVSSFVKVFYSLGKRIGDSLPFIILPMQTIGQDLLRRITYLYQSAGLALLRTTRSFTTSLFSAFGGQLENAINEVFQADSIEEFQAAMEKLSEAIEFQGKRWYNITGNVARAFYSMRAGFIESLIYFRLIDQQLIRFERRSLDTLGDGFAYIARVARALVAELSRMAVLAKVFYAVTTAVDLMKASLEGAGNSVKRLFSQVQQVAEAQFPKTFKVIKAIIEQIEYMFFWLYDRVVGNSWWPDMLDRIQETTSSVLPAVLNKFRAFVSTISSFFKDLFAKSTNLDLKLDIDFVGGATEGLNTLLAAIGTAISKLVTSLYSAISTLSPQISQLISVAVLTGVLALTSPALAATISTFFKRALIIGLLAGVALFASEDILDSGFFSDIGKSFGQALGLGITTVIQHIPEITRALFQVVDGFGEAFLSQFGVIGDFINSLGNITGTGGLINTLLFGVGIAAILGKFSAISTVFNTLLSAFTGASFGGVGQNKKGRQEGIIGALLLGDGRVLLASIAGIYSAVTLFSNLANGEFGLAATGLGLIPLFLFGAGGTASLIFDSIKKVGQSFGLFKVPLKFPNLGEDIKELALDLGRLRASKTFEQLKLAAVDFGDSVKRVAVGIADSLKPVFTRVAAAVGPALEVLKGKLSGVFAGLSTAAGPALLRVQAMFAAAMAKMNATAAAAGGPTGVVGKGLFGKFAKGAAIAAAFLAIFTGVASAGTDSLTSMVDGWAWTDIGAIGIMLLGAGGLDLIPAKAGTYALKAGKAIIGVLGSVVSSIGGLVGRIGLSIAASVFGPLLAAAGAFGASILAFILSPITLAVGAVAGTGFLLYWLFGEESALDKEINRLQTKAENLRTDLEAAFAPEKLNALLDAAGSKIDLNAILDVTALQNMSETQLDQIRIAMNSFNEVMERNNEELRSTGEITETGLQEQKAALDRIAGLLEKPPAVGQNPEQAGQLRDSILAAITASAGDKFSSGSLEAFKDRNVKNPLAGFTTGNLDPATQKLVELFDSINNIDLARISPEAATAYFEQVAAYLAVFESSDTAGLFGLAINQDKIDSLSQRIGDGVLDQAVATAEELFANAKASQLRAERLAKIELDAKTLGLSGLDNKSLLQLPERELQQIETLVATYFNGVKTATQKLGKVDLGDGTLQTRAPTQEEAKLRVKIEQQIQELLSNVGKDVVVGTETIVDELNTKLSAVGSKVQVGELVDNAAYQRALNLISQIEQKQLEASQIKFDDFGESRLNEVNKEIEALQGVLFDTLATTEQQLEAVSDGVGSIPDINSVLALSPELINRVIAYANEIRRLLALLSGGLAGVGPGAVNSPVGNSVEDRVRAGIGNAQTNIANLSAGLNPSGSNKGYNPINTPPVDTSGGGGGGGGGGEAAKSWWEEFQETIDVLDLSLDVNILAGLGPETFSGLLKASEKYKQAQELINSAAAGEVEQRRKALKLMQEARAEAINALNDGTFGGAKAAIESAGAELDDAMLGRLNAASAAYITQFALRIDQLEQERNAMTLGSAAAMQATNAISAMKLQLESMTQSSQIMRDAFNSGLQSFLKGQSTFKEFAEGLLDTFTNTIIEKFTTSFTDGLFNSLGLDNLFGSLFGGASKLGSGLGGGGKGLLQPGSTFANPLYTKSVDDALGGLGGLLGGGKGGGGKGGGGFLAGLFGGGGGGGGFLSIIMSLFGGLFGFADGGQISGAGTGRSDSILARVSDGEYIVNSASTKQWLPVLNAINSKKMPAFANGGMVGPSNPSAVVSAMKAGPGGSTQQQFNINVTGDVSAQTRKEIVAMMPEISAGVSMTQRERGSR